MAKRRICRKITDQLRKAIDDSGLSRYRIAQETGIDQAVLSGFMAGKRGFSLEALDRLGAFLNLEVVAHGSKRTVRSPGRKASS